MNNGRDCKEYKTTGFKIQKRSSRDAVVHKIHRKVAGLRTPFFIEHLWWLLLKVIAGLFLTLINVIDL